MGSIPAGDVVDIRWRKACPRLGAEGDDENLGAGKDACITVPLPREDQRASLRRNANIAASAPASSINVRPVSGTATVVLVELVVPVMVVVDDGCLLM